MPSNLSPLTIIILTHQVNEKFLRALHTSHWADQIVVIANQVEFDWKKITAKYRFELKKWDKGITDFSEIRNWALQFAHHDWVLFLDSDEWITDELKQEIVETVSNPTHSAYALKRHDLFHDQLLQFGEVGNVRIVRLFDRRVGKWQGKIHEEWVTKKSVGELQYPLLHEAHDDLNSFLQKINNYTSLSTIDESLTNNELVLKSLIYPIGKFVKNYFFLQGFRDGWAGFIYAYMMSLHSLMVRIKQYEKNVG